MVSKHEENERELLAAQEANNSENILFFQKKGGELQREHESASKRWDEEVSERSHPNTNTPTKILN
mgnify:CR=1 FL=1